MAWILITGIRACITALAQGPMCVNRRKPLIAFTINSLRRGSYIFCGSGVPILNLFTGPERARHKSYVFTVPTNAHSLELGIWSNQRNTDMLWRPQSLCTCALVSSNKCTKASHDQTGCLSLLVCVSQQNVTLSKDLLREPRDVISCSVGCGGSSSVGEWVITQTTIIAALSSFCQMNMQRRFHK